MATEGELKALLTELQQKHPLKGGDQVSLLFGGWGFASSDIEDKSIVMPRSWLRNDAWSHFVIIHEYAHFLSQDNAKGLRKHLRLLHNFLAHDKLFRETETALAAEYGIRIKRWIIYPREIETPWGNPSILDFLTLPEVCIHGLWYNLYGLAIAMLLLTFMRGSTPSQALSLFSYIVAVLLIEEWSATIVQGQLRRKHRRAGESGA